MTGRLTLPWALLVLVVATAIGIGINHLVEAEWIAPVVMALIMGGLFFYGRIEQRNRRDEHESDLRTPESKEKNI